MKIQKRAYRTVVFISLILCGIIVFGGGQVSADEWTSAQKEVWKAIENAWEALKLGKIDVATYVGGSLEWWSDQIIPFGGDRLVMAYQRWLAYDKPVSYELKPLQIFIYGNVANVFYISKWKGKEIGDTGRHMETWVKQDNKWKFLGSMACSCEKAPKCP
ncbi:MAG: nuclear transport factor 2 family protein [Desulfobacteraceae bacterium]|jgi:hypothetical protein